MLTVKSSWNIWKGVRNFATNTIWFSAHFTNLGWGAIRIRVKSGSGWLLWLGFMFRFHIWFVFGCNMTHIIWVAATMTLWFFYNVIVAYMSHSLWVSAIWLMVSHHERGWVTMRRYESSWVIMSHCESNIHHMCEIRLNIDGPGMFSY